MAKKKTYTAQEKQAYYMGVGAALAAAKAQAIKKAVSNMPESVKKSFYNGWESVMVKKKF